jgi:hypothetical protein
VDEREGELALREVAPDGLADDGLLAHEVEQVVLDLEGDAHVASRSA